MTDSLSGAALTVKAAPVITGVGLGLREKHIEEILQTSPVVPWFEVLADNFIARGGFVPAQLSAIREKYPITFHCVGMSLAGVTPLDAEYLSNIKRLAEDFQPAWISDHLCFTQHGQHHFHDLLPFPYTEKTLEHVSERILQVQDVLGQRILVENVSSYLEFEESDLSEAQFIAELLKISDCDLLLDLNNIHVSAQNHAFNAMDYLALMPLERVKEIHLAGFDDRGDYLLDAHNNPVSQPVWELYQYVLGHVADIPTLIEWDNDIPPLSMVMAEANKAECLIETTFLAKGAV